MSEANEAATQQKVLEVMTALCKLQEVIDDLPLPDDAREEAGALSVAYDHLDAAHKALGLAFL